MTVKVILGIEDCKNPTSVISWVRSRVFMTMKVMLGIFAGKTRLLYKCKGTHVSSNMDELT